MKTNIAYEKGNFSVWITKEGHTVIRSLGTEYYPDSSYANTLDGLAIAVSRVDYCAKQEAAGKIPEFFEWRRKKIAYNNRPEVDE